MNKEGGIIRSLYKSTVVSIVISAVAAMFGMLIDGVIICKFLGTDSMSAYPLVMLFAGARSGSVDMVDEAVLAFADLCLRSSAVRSQYASC